MIKKKFYLDKRISGYAPETEIIEFEDDVTEETMHEIFNDWVIDRVETMILEEDVEVPEQRIAPFGFVKTNMLNGKDWSEFRQSGMLWMINSMLQLFGWSIIFNYTVDGEITSVYPARSKYRGFDEATNTKGYIAVSQYMKDNADKLLEEARH